MAAETNRMRPYAASTGSQASSMMEQSTRMMNEGYRQAEHVVQEYPASSVLITFGLGFAVGYFATALLAPPRKTWYERGFDRASEQARRGYDQARRAPEQLGGLGQRIADAVMNALPDAITRHI